MLLQCKSYVIAFTTILWLVAVFQDKVCWFVVSISIQQNNKTTKSQNNKTTKPHYLRSITSALG